MKTALFIFRRDLRLEDNLGLLYALKNYEKVIPAFIFTPEQIEENPYRSDHCLQFMLESLEDLEQQLQTKQAKLYLFYGSPHAIVERCINELHIDGVILNRDYTPYSLQRDEKIERICHHYNISFQSFDDVLLNAPENTLKKDGNPYVIFTPFYRAALQYPIAPPQNNIYNNFYTLPISFAVAQDIYKKILPKRTSQIKGGRTAALSILSHFKTFADYESTRDYPAQEKTTHLSSHLKFNTCSIREVYWAATQQLGPAAEPFLRSLYWRDFFSSIAFYFPQVFKGAFQEQYNGIQWSNHEANFKKWCDGMTGFPIVDAGMRQMNQTGFMHNRVRMIVASFLVKDLHIDWRWGEQYFAQMLIDYDPAVNNGNWQWAASTGCDAQPYFRIFNPWNQSAKFDPDCVYIKKWVPELNNVPSSAIHKWYLEKNHADSKIYPAPIVDHAVASKKAIEMYVKQ